MDKFIQQELNDIKQAAESILCRISGIYGYCNGMETAAKRYFSSSQPQLNNGNRFGTQPKTIYEEIEEMIIELKINGSLREHRNGLYKFTMSNGKISVYGRTREEIQKKLEEQIKQFNKKQSHKGKTNKEVNRSLLLSEFYRQDYLPYKINENIAKSTISGYESRIRFILKKNFDKSLHLYKPKDIEDFLYSFPETRKRQQMRDFLNNLFKKAVTSSKIKNNPCNTIKKPKHKEEQGTSYSFIELKQFLQILFDNQHLSHANKCYFIFVFLTGTRRDEARLITVDDVDFENKILHIDGTKTDGSDRDIPLLPIVEKLLLSLNVKKGSYFTISQANADKYFRKVWEKEKGHKLHDLRHTFGTIKICVEKLDVKTVSLLMGHSTIDTTLRIYTHPEQLDKVTFLNGGLTDKEKLNIYQMKYEEILTLIKAFI